MNCKEVGDSGDNRSDILKDSQIIPIPW